MKTEKNILIAFILNLTFSVFELIGGMFTGSVAIISDSIHDFGDAASIGISYLLEKKSKRQPDELYTYGYSRYSVIGGFVTTVILLAGSLIVILNAIKKLLTPNEIHYNGMIIFALVGVTVNFIAAQATRNGDSINLKAVNLHMLEDVLGWIVVLAGAVLMRFTEWVIIDPIISIGVAIFIVINSVRNLKKVLDLFLEKIPDGISVNEIRDEISEIEGVYDVHHIHIRSIDGQSVCATMHIRCNNNRHEIKENVRKKLNDHGIIHSTLELEDTDEECHDIRCGIKTNDDGGCHLHHHH